LAELGGRLKVGLLREADALWVNDPTLGVHCLLRRLSIVYDVTDDWRTYDFPERIIRRIIRAEDILAQRARTVVCSEQLKSRWRERYDIDATVIHNGVDSAAWRSAVPHKFDGPGPHVGYVGTLQPERLDIELALQVASDERVGSLHLIGPDALDGASRQRLMTHPSVVMHDPIDSSEVPSWTMGLDVLICPHVVSPFTLSLDAIKSYEYLASGRPVVATPTSGFQLLTGRQGVYITPAQEFLSAVAAALHQPPPLPVLDENDWSTRARAFAKALTEGGS
jgi:glycosyltransferase involved in cell wall biosynthesis